MNETGIFALIGVAGGALLFHGIDLWLQRRKQKKRLIKIVMANQSDVEQQRRKFLYQDDTENSWYRP